MAFDETEFYKKLAREIDRLEKTASTLRGAERKLVLDMASSLEKELNRFKVGKEIDSSISSEESERALAAIIDVLNKVEMQLKDLEVTLGKKDRVFITSKEVANTIVHQFFLDCQVAEERIKNSEKRKHITKEQVSDLNMQLKTLVHRMVTLSKQSEFLIDAVLQHYEAKTLI